MRIAQDFMGTAGSQQGDTVWRLTNRSGLERGAGGDAWWIFSALVGCGRGAVVLQSISSVTAAGLC